MLKVKVNAKKEYDIEFKNESEGTINGKEFNWDVYSIKDTCGCFNVLKNDHSLNASVLESDFDAKKFVISVRGNAYQIEVKDRFDQLLTNLGLENALVQKIDDIKAPMPGLVLKFMKNEGDTVVKGESILVLEAMKMENVIKSPTDGVINQIKVKQGQAVEKNQVLLTFK